MAAGISDFSLRADSGGAPLLLLPVVRCQLLEPLAPCKPKTIEPPAPLPANSPALPLVELAPANSADSPVVLKQAQVVLTSLAVHLLVLIMLALLTCTFPRNSWLTILEVAFTEESLTVEQVVEISLEPVEETVVDSRPGEAIDVTPVEIGEEALAPLTVANGKVNASGHVDSLFTAAGVASQDSRKGQPSEYVAEFFGVRAVGKRFVFIVDQSHSMQGRKFADAKAELQYSIRKLSPDQSFYVIFFNHTHQRMRLAEKRDPADELVPATGPNIQKMNTWLRKVFADGGTNPHSAVEFALSLKPDAIFLLTDGEFQDHGQTAQLLADTNIADNQEHRKRPVVAVHTIGFGENVHEAVLEKIAQDNRGTYRYAAERP